MKQLLVLSGKGGTGKTTVASALIAISKARTYADCDVDAPNLHLAINPSSSPRVSDYYDLPKAWINPELCSGCDICRQVCRFDAVVPGDTYSIDPYACEGCGLCGEVCPESAVEFRKTVAGHCLLYEDEEKVFSTAQLKMGHGTTGLLVTRVKNDMEKYAVTDDIAVIDGSPGIGCPVIASLRGVDLALIVVEPSLSGLSDMDRVIQTADTFSVPVCICINQYDTVPALTEKIERRCEERGWPLVGKIPHDKELVKTLNEGKNPLDSQGEGATALRNMYKQTRLFMDYLFE